MKFKKLKDPFLAQIMLVIVLFLSVNFWIEVRAYSLSDEITFALVCSSWTGATQDKCSDDKSLISF